MYTKNKILFIIIPLFLLILGGAGCKQQVQKNTQTQPPLNQTSKNQKQEKKNIIIIDDQRPGEMVVINKSYTKVDSFIAIHENDNNTPGKIIGVSKLLNKNVEYSGLRIKLDRPSKKGELLFAMVHKDNGNGKFNFPGEDLPLKDQNNKILIKPFNIISIEDVKNKNTNNTKPKNELKVITYTDKGFSPVRVEIKQGDTIKFINESSELVWPAVNPHPIHTGYPEKGGCMDSIFDACRGLSKGESYSFTFKYKGEWTYHNHLNPGKGGIIIVK